MNQISKEALEFLNEAKEQFSKNGEMNTYRDADENFIALRTGLFEDCIMVYELGNPIGNFIEQLPRQQKVVIDYDKLEEYKNIREKVSSHLKKVDIIANYSGTDYNKGYKAALEFILDRIGD